MTGTLTPTLRLLSFWVPLVLSTLGGAYVMFDILSVEGVTPVELAILISFIPCFGWVAWSFWLAVVGFLIQLLARHPVSFAAPLESGASAPINSRVAVVMPVYNESPKRVFAGVEATIRSLENTGESEDFDFFVLSDSTDPTLAAEERQRWEALCRRFGTRGRIHYRRRSCNTGRKVGNIAEFCDRWGHQFDFMIMLDADSVMSGRALVRLARTMQANPKVGIIQMVPMPVNQTTLFARLIQFSCRLCSELMMTGQCYWQSGTGNYFGHNAIIRIKPFVQYCRLPILTGKPPFGGAILSHDFIEAAFMRRAGWEVWNLPDADGSYEETPTNLLDHATRDRRWCQGNMQHLRLLLARGLHPLSRVHLALGVLAYLASPFWLLLLVLGLVLMVQQASVTPLYFAMEFNLFPIWPIVKSTEAISLFAVTILMLLAPKLLGASLVLLSKRRRRAYGGAHRVLLGTCTEIFCSALLAPVMMVFQAGFVISILAGRSVEWRTQTRSSRPFAPLEILFRLRWQLALGILVGVTVVTVAPDFIWWFSPLLAGLLLSVPMAIGYGRTDYGLGLLRAGVFCTPEEIAPPVELQALVDSPRIGYIAKAKPGADVAADATAGL